MVKEPEIVLTGLWGFISRKLGIPAWGQVPLACLIPITLAFGGILAHIEIKLASIETKVEMIPLKFSSALLSQAKEFAKNGRPEDATHAIGSATALVTDAKKQHVTAPPQFFSDQITTASEIESSTSELKSNVNELRFALASYRSELTPPPTVPRPTQELQTHTFTAAPLQSIGYMIATSISFVPAKPITVVGYGAALVAAIPENKDLFIPATAFLDINPVIIQGLMIVNATQTLDFITWQDVTFVNAHIKYQRGPVRLKNVRFVNCTFDLPNNDAGARLAEYAALLPKETVEVG